MNQKNEVNKVLYEANPAIFKSHIFRTMISFLLIVGGVVSIFSAEVIIEVSAVISGVGLINLLPLWLKAKGKKLTIRERDVQVTKGILSKSTNEVPLDSITNIRTEQSLIERILNVGKISISTSATSGKEMVITEFSNPDLITNIIKENK